MMAATAADFVANTPVKVGWLRASWTVTVEGAAMDGAPEAPDPGGDATVARLQAGIAAVPDGARISFRNVAPYAQFVEFGTSKMAPRAFIRGTIAHIPVIAAEVAAWGAGDAP